ncbi:MAG: T9SS type A sorting domain-containing protein [Acidobacteriota bacterium]
MIDFPNMDTVDAIRSAPENNYYNCASWSGGITTSNEWPPNYGSNWNNGNSSHSDTLAAFDNYYGNKDRYGIEELRYADSRKWNYTNSGADASNSQIALWVTPTGLFQHASVNSRWDNISYAEPADSNAHGYDWESKDGNGPRVFHPRDAIGGEPGYGQISRYYKLASGLLKQGARFVTSDESIQSGASVLDNGALTKSELAKLDSLKQFINGQELQDFVTKYLAWKKTWSTPAIRKYSDPRKYAESREYYDFLGYCREKGKKIFPLLLEQLDPEDFFLIVAIEDLTYAGSEKLMEEVHQENRSHRYTEQGAFIMHSLLGNWMKYGKKILSRFAEYNGFVQAPQQFATSEPGKGPNESIFLQNYPNPFNPSTEIKYWLASAGEVSVKVYDILGKEVSVIVDNKFQEQGSYTVRWNGKLAGGDQAPSGVYFCRVQTNSVSQIVKLLLMR